MADVPETEVVAGTGIEVATTATQSDDYQVRTTLPNEVLRHDISDEELEMFRHWRTDNLTDILLTALGAAIGSFVGASKNVYNCFWKVDGPPLDFPGLLEITVFGISLSILLVCWLVASKRGGSFDRKISDIRTRTRARLRQPASVTSHTSAAQTDSQSPPGTQ